MKSIFDSQSGDKATNIEQPFILVLKRGENLFSSLTHFIVEANLQAASISGLGALDDVTIAFYHLDRKEYDTKLFHGGYELVSLNGNITRFENKPVIHIHAALGKEDYSVIGGHIMDATIGPTVELTIIPLPGKINRERSEDIGLNLMCPISS